MEKTGRQIAAFFVTLLSMKVNIPKGAKKKITGSNDVYKIMQAILLRQTKLRRKKEYFWAIGLNVSSDILFIELVSMGSLTKTVVEPLEVFWLATNKKCNRVILVHNHTGTSVAPSEADIKLTRTLQKGGELLGIKIEDHLIITEENGYYSFADKKSL